MGWLPDAKFEVTREEKKRGEVPKRRKKKQRRGKRLARVEAKGRWNDGVMVRWPDAKCEVTRKKKKSREAKKKQTEEQRSKEERRDSLETKQIENSHFTGGKVKQHHKIVNIQFTILKKTCGKTLRGSRHFEERPFQRGRQRILEKLPNIDLREV